MVQVLTKFTYLIGRDQRYRWWFLIALAILAGVLEMLGAALVFLVLGLVADPGGNLDLPIIGELPAIGDVGESSTILLILGAIAGFFVIRAGIRVWQAYYQQKMIYETAASVSKRMVQGYLAMPYSFHLQRNSAELIRTAHGTPQALSTQVFLPIVQIAAESVLLAGLIVLLVLTAPIATALALGFMAPTVWILVKFIQPRLKALGVVSHDMRYETLTTMQQSLEGLRDIKILGKEESFSDTYGDNRDQLARADYALGTSQILPRTMIETVLLIFILAYFGFSIVQGASAVDTLPVLGLFAYAGLRMQPSIQTIVRGINNIKFSSYALDDIYDELVMIETENPEIHTKDAVPLPFGDEIVMEGLTYRYEESDRPAVEDASFRMARGDFVGVCGSTGGGKTTLIDMISGLLPPTTGSVRVDGVDIHDDVRRWQANLGVVSQNVFLVDDTVRRNIALGVPDDRVDEEALAEAIRQAQLTTFIDSLPKGLETMVGEHGVRISGGQRQRVAIARALYRDPAMLLMDEGTSALDNITEGQLVEMLENVRGEKTIVIVAHRLSSVRNCDYIIFVEDGKVVDVAPYEELVESNMTFRQMAAGS